MHSLTFLVTLLAALTFRLSVCMRWDETGSGTLYTLDIEHDVTLQHDRNNYGSVYLHTGQFGESSRKRALLHFQDLPVECQKINWAMMFVYYVQSYKPDTFTSFQSPDIPRPIEVYQVHKRWDEQMATRDVRLYNTPWDVPLLNISGSDAGPLVLDTVTVTPRRPASYVTFNVSCALAQKLDHDHNHGFLLRAQNEHVIGTDIWWYSQKHNDPSKHPVIQVLCDSPRDSGFDVQRCGREDPEPNLVPRTRAATNRVPVQGTQRGVDIYSQGYHGIPLQSVFPEMRTATVCDDLISRCPNVYPSYGRLLPHPTHPNRYCSCRYCDVQGVTMRDMACPAGFSFNFNLQECIPAEDCGCN